MAANPIIEPHVRLWHGRSMKPATTNSFRPHPHIQPVHIKMSNETTLPPIRRIAVVHDTSTGKQEVQDDTLQGKTLPHGPTAYNGYVHEGITGDPKDGLKGTRVMPDAGLVQTNGVTFTYLGRC